MRKPILLGALKAVVILYFAACANVEDDNSVYQSVTPVVTKGSWKVNLYMDANMDKTNDFAGYTFTFSGNGDVTAAKGATTISGNWYEDNTSKRVLINLGTADPLLVSLNDAWKIAAVSTTNVSMQSQNTATPERLIITNQ